MHGVDENVEEKESFMSFFKEHDTVTALLTPERFQAAEAHTQICEILERYQEQPELLDPHLEAMVTALISYVPRKLEKFDNSLLNRVFQVLYTLMKTRGYKTIMKFLSHEAADLEPILFLLANLDKRDPDSWFSGYGLLIWLAVVVLVPFPLTTIDSSKTEDITTRIIETGKSYLGQSSVTRDAAAVMLSRLFSRPDMDSTHLDNFFFWAIDTVKKNPSNNLLVTGIMTALFQISRHGPRAAVQKHASAVYDQLIKTPLKLCERSGLLRKLNMKVAQRGALSVLKPVVPTWRYQLGARSLLQTMAPNAPSTENKEEQPQEYGEIPEIVDEVIELLLSKGLRDADTVVRWSAAKGLGRISMRLPQEYADEVVESLLPLLSAGEGDGAWHGGCMAFGELARRGLLLPARLGEVIQLGLQALVYDVRSGAHSVGAHVRDAACYLAWSFARAYAPTVMQPYVLDLSRGLLTLAVFDREVNCRRAAAAAFQENVGRQGNFPHGIEINLAADYLALGNRVHASKEVAYFIAQFPEYKEHLILHLGTIKYKHWDVAMRELCASTLAKLCSLPEVPAFVAMQVLPELLVACLADDLAKRHGAVLATSEILLAFASHGVCNLMSEQSQRTILGLPAQMRAAGHFQGKVGGQLMRMAVCLLIQNISRSPLFCSDELVLGMHQLLTENLQHPALEVQLAAVDALKPFLQTYFVPRGSEKKNDADSLEQQGEEKHSWGDDKLTQVLRLYAEGAISSKSNIEARQGFVLALGVFPLVTLATAENLSLVVNTLVAASDLTFEPDPQTRTNAVRSLQVLCHDLRHQITAVIRGPYIPPELRVAKAEKAPLARDDPAEYMWQIRSSSTEDKEESDFLVYEKCFRALFRCLRDYQTDNRGDVGSWVREMAMGAIEAISLLLVEISTAPTSVDDAASAKPDESLVIHTEAVTASKAIPDAATMLNGAIVTLIFQGLSKQMMERINRTRGKAGAAFYKLLFALPNVPHKAALEVCMPANLSLDWSSPSLFKRFLTPFLECESLYAPVISGLVQAVGGLTESVVRESGEALVQYLETDEKSEPFFKEMLRLLKTYSNLLRVVDPVFQTLSFVLNCGVVLEISLPIVVDLQALVWREIANSTNIQKLIHGAPVLVALLTFFPPPSAGADINDGPFPLILELLVHQYPKVRRATADELFSRLLLLDLEQSEAIQAVVADTPWDGTSEQAFAARDQLAALLGVTQHLAPPKQTQREVSGETKESYADLVQSEGY